MSDRICQMRFSKKTTKVTDSSNREPARSPEAADGFVFFVNIGLLPFQNAASIRKYRICPRPALTGYW